MVIKDLVGKIEGNKYVRLVAITAVVLGSFITIGTFFGSIRNYFYDDVFILKNISDRINDLAAGQSISFFKQKLGAEKLQREVSEKYTEYIFQYKSAFIQALANNANNEVVFWAITYCGNSPVVIKRKLFLMAGRSTGEKDIFGNEKDEPVFGDKLLLNSSSFTDIFRKERGDFKYFLGVTADSYAYESLYLGNPSAYLTVIIGVNDVCRSSALEDLFNHLTDNSTPEQIKEFRKNSRVNTYSETAPYMGDEIVKLLDAQQNEEGPFITFGVDRLRIRYFNY